MTTRNRYKEAGLRPPQHNERVSEDVHTIDPELQSVDSTPNPKRARTSRTRTTTPTTPKES